MQQSPAAQELPAELPLTPYEQLAARICPEYLSERPDYEALYSFGTPGGNDLDLRLCFSRMADVPEQTVRETVIERLHAAGVDVDIDLLFMTGDEFEYGIRDLVELGDVEEDLKNGFDPHDGQRAVKDTSMFTLYICATMRELHRSPSAAYLLTPDEALQRLQLTPEGAVGWMHFYTGCFLHEYLRHHQDPVALRNYQERLAKFASRVISGSILAELDESQLEILKPQLIDAVRAATPERSADATMTDVLRANGLLEPVTDELLTLAGDIRSNPDMEVPESFIPAAEALLFSYAFQQGQHRRPEIGEDADWLTSYAMAEFIRDLGERRVIPPNTTLMRQGEYGTEMMYIPLKTQDGRDNVGVDVEVTNGTAKPIRYMRSPGRTVGELAVLGAPRSATVTTDKERETEVYVLHTDVVRNMLKDDATYAELQKPVLSSFGARRADVFMRHAAREAIFYLRQTLPYTTLASREQAEAVLGDNPFARYNLGHRFHDVLQLFTGQPGSAPDRPAVTEIAADEAPQTLFTAGNTTGDVFYVVTEGSVDITLQNGHQEAGVAPEVVTLQPGEYFGESSLVGMSATGTAMLTEGSRVLAVDARWFKRMAQSRQPLRGVAVPEGLKDVLPVHLLYHIATEGYDRVRRRAVTQQN